MFVADESVAVAERRGWLLVKKTWRRWPHDELVASRGLGNLKYGSFIT